MSNLWEKVWCYVIGFALYFIGILEHFGIENPSSTGWESGVTAIVGVMVIGLAVMMSDLD